MPGVSAGRGVWAALRQVFGGWGVPVLMACFAAPALAHENLADHIAGGALRCTFVMECYETEACAEADWQAYVLMSGRGMNTARLVMPDQTVRAGATRRDDGSATVAGEGDGGIYLLTLAENGAARLALHLTEGPQMVNYMGFCEALE
ncbi:hypothetical protein AADZ90_010385 [Aestuariibius sp. 2305UL40-4]|uniref:hypothetical protein n=1 Tax=Aestuariibius violaceus TaxID=3234132 RepID=UPI00345EDB89